MDWQRRLEMPSVLFAFIYCVGLYLLLIIIYCRFCFVRVELWSVQFRLCSGLFQTLNNQYLLIKGTKSNWFSHLSIEHTEIPFNSFGQPEQIQLRITLMARSTIKLLAIRLCLEACECRERNIYFGEIFCAKFGFDSAGNVNAQIG